MSRLIKLNTGIVTEFQNKGGKVNVNYPDDKFLKHNNNFHAFKVLKKI